MTLEWVAQCRAERGLRAGTRPALVAAVATVGLGFVLRIVVVTRRVNAPVGAVIRA